MSSSADVEGILYAIRTFVPQLTADKHKGQAGKIAVMGGCREYTGAPFFAAISALKLGADLSHVFCSQEAATVIKTYSPELIVHPVMRESYDTTFKSEQERLKTVEKVVDEVTQQLPRFDCLAVGSGLGRDQLMLDCVAKVIKEAREINLPVVIDGDGLWLINKHPDLVKGYRLALLTPNVNEHRRLVDAVLGEGKGKFEQDPEQLKELASRLEGVTILQKGKEDLISDGTRVLSMGLFGSPRRCGGQGDLTAGSAALFTAWARQFVEQQKDQGHEKSKVLEERLSSNPTMMGAFAGALIVRHASHEGFKKHKRSMTTTEVIAELGTSVETLFPSTPANSNL